MHATIILLVLSNSQDIILATKNVSNSFEKNEISNRGGVVGIRLYENNNVISSTIY
jgi:hypothetical protein